MPVYKDEGDRRWLLTLLRAGVCEALADWPWSACRYELG